MTKVAYRRLVALWFSLSAVACGGNITGGGGVDAGPADATSPFVDAKLRDAPLFDVPGAMADAPTGGAPDAKIAPDAPTGGVPDASAARMAAPTCLPVACQGAGEVLVTVTVPPVTTISLIPGIANNASASGEPLASSAEPKRRAAPSSSGSLTTKRQRPPSIGSAWMRMSRSTDRSIGRPRPSGQLDALGRGRPRTRTSNRVARVSSLRSSGPRPLSATRAPGLTRRRP